MLRSRTAIVFAAAVIGLAVGLGGAFIVFDQRSESPKPSAGVLQEAPRLTPARDLQPTAAVTEPPHTLTQPSAEPVSRTPRIGTVDCWFKPNPEIPTKCVHLFVRENKADANSPIRRLNAVVFKGGSGNGEPPLAFLVGGPGEPARIGPGEIDRWWSWIAEDAWMRGRDLVVFDHRGVGMSEPNMACPEMAEAGLSIFRDGTTLSETGERWRRAGESCIARLSASGIDVAQYNSRAIADDLHTLLSQLGYRSWYLFGVSFGTRVALSFMRDHPEGTRGVILDSVYPPNVQAYVQSAQSAAAAFNAIFKQCEANPACRKTYPDLARKLETVIRRAEQTPYTVVLDGPDKLTLKVDQVRLIEILFYAFYGWRDIMEIPVAITALEAGDTRPLAKLAAAARRFYEWPGASHGLFLAVACGDEMPANPRQAVAAEAAREPLFEAFALSNPPLSACRGDGAVQSNAPERELPTAPIPVLMLSGELDPITPPQWAAELAKKLPNATLVRFGAVGHGVVSSHGCAGRLIAAFLDDPSRPPFDPCQLALGPTDFSPVTGTTAQNGVAGRGGGRAR